MDMIETLDDAAAINAIGAISRGISVDDTVSLDAPKQLAMEWRKAFGDPDSSDAPATEGDLARATLQWLAMDPKHRRTIEAIATAPASQQDDTITIGSILLVLLLLKDSGVVGFKDGGWRIKGKPTERMDARLKKVFDILSMLSSR